MEPEPCPGYPRERLDTAGWRLQFKNSEQGKSAPKAEGGRLSNWVGGMGWQPLAAVPCSFVFGVIINSLTGAASQGFLSGVYDSGYAGGGGPLARLSHF